MESNNKNRCFDEIFYYKFVDNELDRADREKVRDHLGTCAKCRQFVDAIAAENTAIKELFETETAVPDLTAAVMKRLNNEQISLGRWQRWLPYAAVFVLTAFLFIFLFTGGPGREEPRESGVLLHSARIEGKAASPHIFESKDPDVKFIWLEK